MKHTIYITRSPRQFLYNVVPPMTEDVIFNPDLQTFNPNKTNYPSEMVCWSEIFINTLGAAIENGSANHEDWTINIEGNICKFDSGGMLDSNWVCGWFLPAPLPISIGK
jgi:hypothetical protein